MTDVRILIVDNEDNWLESLPKVLWQRLDPNLKIEVAKSYAEALQKVKSKSYDLVSVDLELLGEINPSANPTLGGMDLLRECRSSARNQGCGLMILSGRATPGAVYEALEGFGINVYMDKSNFADGAPYVVAVQTAIRRARLQQAKRELETRYHLTVTCNQNSLVRGVLVGPNHRSETPEIKNPIYVDFEDLARRADELNLRLGRGEVGAWRLEARSVGMAIYQAMAAQQQILSLLSTALALASSHAAGNLSLQFEGPPSGLSVPFELMRDEDEYFALSHILTRRLSQGGPRYTHKSIPFFKFIEEQVAKKEPLRVLIAGANTDGGIPGVEEEASRLADSIRFHLKILGIPYEITPLLGNDVTYNNLRDALLDGQHIFHFAGHGDFDTSLPEKSPLVLSDRTLTAADLKTLTQKTELRFAFLSCCLSARTGGQVGRGDFHGFLHALSLADVPAALAYRWEVRDDSALELATDFYGFLWQHFCPGQALLHSRREISSGNDGRDDETWAAPILLSQTT